MDSKKEIWLLLYINYYQIVIYLYELFDIKNYFLLCQISINTFCKRKTHLKVTEEADVEVSTNSFPAVASSSAVKHEIILETDDGRVDVGCNAPPRHIFQYAYADSSIMEIQGRAKEIPAAGCENPPKMLFVT